MTSQMAVNRLDAFAPEPPSEDVQHVAGVGLTVTSVADAADAIVEAGRSLRGAGEARGLHVHLASAQTIALAARDADMDAAINGGGWTLPDGKPAVLISWFRGDRPRLKQTRGIEVFDATCRRGLRSGAKHYLLGSTPDTLRLMEARMKERYPGIRVVGSFSPPFRVPTDEELRARDEAIVASGAEIVWVGLGTPKQDFEAVRLAATVPAAAVAVGAVFDFTAGTLALAPGWMSRFGVEWLHRLVSEPRRLWRRYTVESGQFIAAALRWGRRRRTSAT